MLFRKSFAAVVLIAFTVAGCAQQPKLTADELAKLQGGRTTVVAYFQCAPINYLTGGKIMTYTPTIRVDGKEVGKIEYCGHTRFTVDSGQRQLVISNPNSVFNRDGTSRPQIFRPGATQYLSIQQDGYYVITHHWVRKADADTGIAALDKIKPVF